MITNGLSDERARASRVFLFQLQNSSRWMLKSLKLRKSSFNEGFDERSTYHRHQSYQVLSPKTASFQAQNAPHAWELYCFVFFETLSFCQHLIREKKQISFFRKIFVQTAVFAFWTVHRDASHWSRWNGLSWRQFNRPASIYFVNNFISMKNLDINSSKQTEAQLNSHDDDGALPWITLVVVDQFWIKR